ncbi:hypothetical protein [Pseudomonas sp. BN607]|uniref:hypothetical protein n=1 Tax=Pseudomonas sp. BN607 TaxID=2567895 RepID=UPI002454D053|nr:hypothetical protein [Pseudomonas sp. BN607]MDH4552739.1 hypothetical protein [Pseudomonas sp. BN607]
MARITKAQKAGLDFLDQMTFHDLVVSQGMTFEERGQLDTVIERVRGMAERKFSGREAEVITHLAYCFLEISLANKADEWFKVCPVDVQPCDLPAETIEAIESYTKVFQMAVMLVLVSKSTGIEADYAEVISETLKEEFLKYSPLVRRDLSRRCFVREFQNSSVDIYCWLAGAGVLAVTKNGQDRLKADFSEGFIQRLILVADHEMVSNYFKVSISKDNSIAVFLDHPHFELSEAAVDQVLDVQRVFNESRTKASLRGIPSLAVRDITNQDEVRRFFEDFGKRKSRLRMHPGTLASWPGVLGGVMVDKQIGYEYYAAAQERCDPDITGVQEFLISELKIPAIFNACDNSYTISEAVRKQILGFGLSINADTLYRSHSTLRKTIFRMVGLYCQMTRDAGVVMSPSHEDVFYASVFVHADKLSGSNGRKLRLS